jgi:electron transfer flavoprotein alpha subunit
MGIVERAFILCTAEENKDYLVANCFAKKIFLICVKTYYNELAVDVLSDVLHDDLNVFSSNNFGREMCVRVAYRRGGFSFTSVDRLDENTLYKKIYNGYMRGQFDKPQGQLFVSLSKDIQKSKSEEFPVLTPDVEELDCRNYEKSSSIIRQKVVSVCLNELSDAKKVIVAGNGIKNVEEYKNIREFAKLSGASSAGSRPVVMRGIVPMQRLIGISGETVSPDICITFAISGAPAFWSGIEGAKTIISINNDENTIIFKKCDFGIVGDYKEFIEEWKDYERGGFIE